MVVIVTKLRLNAVNNISLKEFRLSVFSGRKYINSVYVIKMFGAVPLVGRCTKKLTSSRWILIARLLI